MICVEGCYFKNILLAREYQEIILETTSDGADGERAEWSGRERRHAGRMWRLISGFPTLTSPRKIIYFIYVLLHATF